MRKSSFAITATLAVALFAADARASTISHEEAAVLRGEVAAMKARIEELEKRLAVQASAPPSPVPAAAVAAAASAPKPEAGARIEWKGSPRIVQDDRSFKVKGRLQLDANYVSHPSGLVDLGLGFSNEARRIRLGGEGEMGSGIGYKLEVELSDNNVDLVDAFATYKRGPWSLTLGNHNQFQSLDELISDTAGSVMERAAFTDAFNFERRLGLSAQYRKGVLLAQAGIFTDDIGALANDADGPAGGDENNSYSIDGRVVLAPKFGSAQFHLAASAHWRELGRLGGQNVRYRQRPFVHSSNSRLIGTPQLPVTGEFSRGVEFGAVRGRWHTAGEMHWLRAELAGAPSVNFKGGYAEVGYFLTEGDSRTYDNGIFGTPKPKHPFGKDGIGAVQVNLRYDYLDLDDRGVRGGKQNAYIAALVWTPIQYVRFNINYAHLDYDGALPLGDGRTQYGINVIGSRFELDF
jgi:phosphate-selective porin OprO/OprP